MELRPTYPVTTARLRLRPLGPDDTDDLLAYLSLPEVCRYVPFEPMDRARVTANLAGQWARHQITTDGEGIVLGAELAETGRVVGGFNLWFHSAEHRSGEIGWTLNPAHEGRGYATEAAHAILHLAFDGLGLHRVVARVDARNEPSLRLADRLGMRREAYLVENEWFKGGWSDEVDFALLEGEWAAQHHDNPPPWCAAQSG